MLLSPEGAGAWAARLALPPLPSSVHHRAVRLLLVGGSHCPALRWVKAEAGTLTGRPCMRERAAL